MAKIFNVRLPDAGAQYSASQFNQLVRSLEQIVLQLNNTYTSTINDSNSSALTFFEAGGMGGPMDGAENFSLPYATFLDRTTQTAALTNTAYAIPMQIQHLSNGVYRDSVNTSRVYVDQGGVYNFQFSAQLDKASGGAATAWIWPRINGVDVGASATKITVQGSSAHAVAAWNFVLDLNGGDYFELMWAVSNTGLVILAEAATAFCPSIPSLILTVTYVSSISELGPNVAYMPQGVRGIGRIGTVFAPGVTPSGVLGTGEIGDAVVIPEIPVPSGSVEGTGGAGDVDIVGTASLVPAGVAGIGLIGIVGNATIQVVGVGGTGQILTTEVVIDAADAANGVDGSGGIGNVAITGNATVSLSGIAATGGVADVNVTV